MAPPHRGQTRLMIDEIRLALDSPGSISMILIFHSFLVVFSIANQPIDGDARRKPTTDVV